MFTAETNQKILPQLKRRISPTEGVVRKRQLNMTEGTRQKGQGQQHSITTVEKCKSTGSSGYFQKKMGTSQVS